MEIAEILEGIVELQATDSGLDELEKIKKNFQLEIKGLDNQLSGLKNSVQEGKKELENLLKQRKTVEIEVGTCESRISKYVDQQNEVKSNEQYTALKQEIEKSREDKGRLEEKVLEFMFKEDEQKTKIQEFTKQLAAMEKKAADDKKSIQEKIEDCIKASHDKKVEREKKIAALPQEYAEGYEILRNNGKKIAVARIREDQTCSGCNMSIPPQTLNQIRKNIDIQRCNCGRYLYSNV